MSDDNQNPLFADWLEKHRGWPDWFTAGKYTPKCHIVAVANGFHPTGPRLLKQEGAQCGNCRFLYRVQRNVKVFLKCEKLADTHGPATDVRAKWPACQNWMSDSMDLRGFISDGVVEAFCRVSGITLPTAQDWIARYDTPPKTSLEELKEVGAMEAQINQAQDRIMAWKSGHYRKPAMKTPGKTEFDPVE